MGGPKTDILSNLSSSENDLSLVLRLDYFNKSILFTGDIEKVGEDSILQDLGPVDFFKGTPPSWKQNIFR